MAKMGIDKTNHLMVMFIDTRPPANLRGHRGGEDQGALGQGSGPVMLMGMPGGFGADVALPEKGRRLSRWGQTGRQTSTEIWL